MVYPAHALLQFGGSLTQLSGKSEIWTTGIRIAQGSGGNFGFLDDPQAWVTAFAVKLRTWFQLTANGMASSAKLEWVKCNNIRPDGTYKDAITHQATVTPTAGGAATVGVPSYCSVAITLETGLVRGLAARGRIYLPNYTYVATGAQISAGDVTAVLGAGKNLMDAILTTSIASAVVGPVVASKVGTGAIRSLTGLSVDNIYDVQRRRKNRAQSTRTNGPV